MDLQLDIERLGAAIRTHISVAGRPPSDATLAALIAGATNVKEAPAAPAYHVPGPYEIALTVGASLAASGSYATPGAALSAAWMAVPEFYMGRDAYLRELAPMLYATSPPEGKPDGETFDS